MRYICTRGGECDAASRAILSGIAENGGLFAPSTLPHLSLSEIEALSALSYPERAACVLDLLLNDFSHEELLPMMQAAYSTFDTPAVAPVHALNDDTHVLELFHGPTLAFKDMALQVLPRLMTASGKKQNEEHEIAILTATSGDTGKAALAGFKDVEGTSVTVFYPLGGVSAMQEMQMVTSEGSNVHVIGVHGNFDDAQNGVKRLFTDPDFIDKMKEKGCVLSSANSINLGRLVPQVAYYMSACADLLASSAITWEKGLVVSVPTGNFGDILAAWYAMQMGAPIKKLICASNANDVLTTFFKTGVYDRRLPLHKTISPSMDILISSNLERYLYCLADGNSDQVNEWMNALKKDGLYDIGEEKLAAMQQTYFADYADDNMTRAEIRRVFNEHEYVMDTHTAVASHVLNTYRAATQDDTPALIVSTASPYKFPCDVLAALGVKESDAFKALEVLQDLSGVTIPAALSQLHDMPRLHDHACDPADMDQAILKFFEK